MNQYVNKKFTNQYKATIGAGSASISAGSALLILERETNKKYKTIFRDISIRHGVRGPLE